MIAHRWIWWIFGKPPEKSKRNRLWVALNILFTFLIVMEARIVFRAPNISASYDVFKAQFRAPNFDALKFEAWNFDSFTMLWQSFVKS